jgi:hypothetical protein
MQRQLDEMIVFEDLRMDGAEDWAWAVPAEKLQGENGMQASDVPD